MHEFGHFIVAKKSGIRVDEFGLGFPPKVFSKKWGGTVYTLNAIPFGGFVKIFGEDPHTDEISEANKNESFYYKPKWIQALVLIAGVTFNIVFAWMVISLTFFIGSISPLPHNTMGEYNDAHLVVTEILVDSPAQKSGILPGDTIVSISQGNKALTEKLYPETVQKFISESNGALNIKLENSKKEQREISVTPNETVVPGKKAIGISMEWVGKVRYSPVASVVQGAKSTWYLLRETATGLVKFLGKTVLFKSDFSQVSGPVGIAKVVKEANELGFVYLLTITAIISINLAVINLIPFPALDGGRLLFVFIEAIIRKPINQTFVRWANLLGFALLMLLMLVVTTHDVLKLF